MKFKFINQQDPYYQEERFLRWEALEKPLGIPPDFQSTPEEKNSIHLVAINKNKIVGCVLCYPISKEEGRIFDCVIEDEKGGFARQMMHKLEEGLKKRGLSEVYVMAGEENQSFFSHLGYRSEGESFEEYGISYQKMGKKFLISA
jgi:N-acetylglutamate synthase-like GNAT family acetyltransferase